MSAIQTIIEARSGSREAFTSLIRDSEHKMYVIAKGILRSESDVADAMQETIMRAYSGIAKLREPAFFRTWLIRILINECRRIIQQNRKYVSLMKAEDSRGLADDLSVSAQLEMDDLLNGLDLQHKEVVVLFYLEDFTIKDIATMLDISESAVKSRLHRARLKLAVLMRETERGVDDREAISHR